VGQVTKVGTTMPRARIVLASVLASLLQPVEATQASELAPSRVTGGAGNHRSGTYSDLASDDNVYYEHNSGTTSPFTASFYVYFTGVPNDITSLTVHYKGKNSRSCTQTLWIRNWVTSSAVKLDSRTVGDTEVLVENSPGGTLADYISEASGPGELRLRVKCSTTGGTFYTSADLTKVSFTTTPAANTLAPSSTANITGSKRSGTYANLAADDDVYYQHNSNGSSPKTAAFGVYFTGVPNDLTSLTAHYKGKNSRSCTQTLSIRNFATSAWVQFDSRSVGTAEVLVEKPPGGGLADYVSGSSGPGELHLRVKCSTSGGSFYTSADLAKINFTTGTPTSTPTTGDPVIAAAGDIACSTNSASSTTCHHKATSDLLVGAGLAAVLPLGDLQYPNGELANFNAYYQVTWGRVFNISRPVPGNHEYNTSGASGYFSYFNDLPFVSPPGYYSFDIGRWHLIALNSECSEVGGCDAGSPQEKWLRNDLAAHPVSCTLAYWHEPRFSSGSNHGSSAQFHAFWQALYERGAEIVLAGHDHVYERFAPQTPLGVSDPARGIRQFTVGTGGKSLYGFGTPLPTSQVRRDDTFGVLKLTLHPESYDWRFVPEAGKTFTDTGSGTCH
jgi:hypothetical protein